MYKKRLGMVESKYRQANKIGIPIKILRKIQKK